MKYTFLIIITLLCTVSYSANIKWSESIKVAKRAKAPEIIGQDKEYIYLARFQGISKLIIDRYKSGNLNSIFSKEIELEYQGKDLNYIQGYSVNGEQIITSSFYNKKSKTTYFFYQILSKNLSISKPHLIGSILKEKSKLSLSSSLFRYNTEIELFADENNESLFGMIPAGKTDGKERSFNGVLIKNLTEDPIKTQLEINHLTAEFKIVKEALGNDGRHYILGYKTIEETSGTIFKQNVTYRGDIELYVIDTETGKAELIVVELGNEIQQLSFKLTSSGNIFLAGLTSTEEKGVNGTVSILLDSDLNEINRTFDKFPDTFVTSNYSEKQKKKLDKKQEKANKKGKKEPQAIMYNYDIKHILENDNGTFTMLAEQYYIEVVTTTTTNANGGVSTRTTYYYHYDDIIAVNFNKGGNFQWRNLITKSQVSTNDGGFYSSFLPIKDGNDLGIIYNVKGADLEDKAKSEKRSTFCINSIITPEGDMRESILFENEEKENMKIAPKFCSQLNDEEVLIFARTKRGSQIGIITL